MLDSESTILRKRPFLFACSIDCSSKKAVRFISPESISSELTVSYSDVLCEAAAMDKRRYCGLNRPGRAHRNTGRSRLGLRSVRDGVETNRDEH